MCYGEVDKLSGYGLDMWVARQKRYLRQKQDELQIVEKDCRVERANRASLVCEIKLSIRERELNIADLEREQERRALVFVKSGNGIFL